VPEQQFDLSVFLHAVSPRGQHRKARAALALEDLPRCPKSASSGTHKCLGGEFHPKQVRRALEELIEAGAVRCEGSYRWRLHFAVSWPGYRTT
jgi:hypothetical protein